MREPPFRTAPRPRAAAGGSPAGIATALRGTSPRTRRFPVERAGGKRAFDGKPARSRGCVPQCGGDSRRAPPRRRRAGGAMARKGGSRVSFTPHSTTARSKNGGMTPFVERPALRAPLKVRRSHLFRLTGAREAIPGAWNIRGRRYPGPPPNWSGSVFVPVGRGGRVRIGRGRGVLEQGRTD